MNASLMAMFPTFGYLSASPSLSHSLLYLKKDKEQRKGDLLLGTNMVDFALLRNHHRYRPRLGNQFAAACKFTDRLKRLETDEFDRPSKDGSFEVLVVRQFGSLEDLGGIAD
jgi:hypothetical protein